MHPQPRVQIKQSTRASSPQVHRISPAFPAQWFTAYSALSPVTGLFCHRHRSEDLPRNLTPASGRQDHTISPSACASLVSRCCPRPLHPAPNVRDDRETPLLSRRDGPTHTPDLHFGKTEFFCERGWTREPNSTSQTAPDGQISRVISFVPSLRANA
jgi:hypothetical protein